MKKTLAGILVMAMVLSLGATTAFSAGPGNGRCFVDADGDGICDYAGSRCAYVDADGDGICDNCASCQGLGAGCGRGLRRGCGNGFRGGRGR